MGEWRPPACQCLAVAAGPSPRVGMARALPLTGSAAPWGVVYAGEATWSTALQGSVTDFIASPRPFILMDSSFGCGGHFGTPPAASQLGGKHCGDMNIETKVRRLRGFQCGPSEFLGGLLLRATARMDSRPMEACRAGLRAAVVLIEAGRWASTGPRRHHRDKSERAARGPRD